MNINIGLLRPGEANPDDEANVINGAEIIPEDTVYIIELDEAAWLDEWYSHWIWFILVCFTAIFVMVGNYYILVGIRHWIASYPYDECCLTEEE